IAARDAVHAPQDLSRNNEDAQAAAAAEMLGLGDDQQFSKIFGDNKGALANFLNEANAATEYEKRKLRAVRWVGTKDKRTAERNAKKHWYPTFLKMVERHLVNGGMGGGQPGAVIATELALVASRPSYVHREREEAEFHRLVADGAKLIVFVGQAGMG